MATPGLRNLITYLVLELADMGASLGKTKLVKLLYLIDVENYRRRSQMLSGLEWVFYHYGPYSFEIDTELKRLSLDLPQEEVTTQAGFTTITFKPSPNVPSGLGTDFSPAERLVVDRVLREWGMEQLNPILNFVYFNTEPMRDAQRGEVLDFTSIKRITTSTRTAPKVTLPEDLTMALRSRLQTAKSERRRLPLDPPPRFDDVYELGLANMAEAEEYRTPEGDVELTDQAKDHFKEGGESPPLG